MVKLHVVGFPPRFGEIELLELFSHHVTVDELYLATDRYTGKRLGYAFVLLRDTVSANRAIQVFNGIWIERSRMRVRLAINNG